MPGAILFLTLQAQHTGDRQLFVAALIATVAGKLVRVAIDSQRVQEIPIVTFLRFKSGSREEREQQMVRAFIAKHDAAASVAAGVTPSHSRLLFD